MPKLQEINTTNLIKCYLLNEVRVIDEFICDDGLKNEILQELLKRFYKPTYIPLIAILCCFLIVVSRNNIKYERIKKIIFILTFFVLIISET